VSSKFNLKRILRVRYIINTHNVHLRAYSEVRRTRFDLNLKLSQWCKYRLCLRVTTPRNRKTGPSCLHNGCSMV